MFTSKVTVNKSKYVFDKNVLNETILRKSSGDANVQIQFQRGTILLKKEDWKVLVLHLGTLSTSDFYNDGYEYDLQTTQNLEHLNYKIHVIIYRNMSNLLSPCRIPKAGDLGLVIFPYSSCHLSFNFLPDGKSTSS